MDTWSLIQNGQFEEAIRGADLEYLASKNILSLRNKVYALFHLKKYTLAIELIQQIILLNNRQTDVDFIFLGIGNYLSDNLETAIESWEQGRNCKYRDAAGGIEVEVLLYFASLKIDDLKLRNTAVKNINKLIKSRRSTNWPGPLGEYLTEKNDKAQVLSKVSNIHILKQRNLCQANFVFAIKALEAKLVKEYENYLALSVRDNELAYLEQFFYLAKGELERLPHSSAGL